MNFRVDAANALTSAVGAGKKPGVLTGKAYYESVTTIVGAIEQIATSSSEQSSGAEEISKNIEGVSTVAKQSASSAQELAAAAEQLNREIQTMNSLIGQFKVD